ncbi:MAG: dihydroneopterin aldolase [Clostridia bacterium]|nr:dihydroneopterin aldolase [Clostridia bacterium]
MEKIIIKGLKLFAYHGVNPEEKVDGQNFILDITAELDVKKAQLSDNVDHTVSYAKIIKTATAVFTEKSYNLIETAANKVGVAIMQEYPKLRSVTVLLKKPEAPIKAEFEYVAVEDTITREQIMAETVE